MLSFIVIILLMKEYTNQNVDSGLIGLIVIAIVAAIVIILIGSSGKSKQEATPRVKNGIDTLYTSDSGYIIHFTIDSAFKK